MKARGLWKEMEKRIPHCSTLTAWSMKKIDAALYEFRGKKRIYSTTNNMMYALNDD